MIRHFHSNHHFCLFSEMYYVLRDCSGGRYEEESRWVAGWGQSVNRFRPGERERERAWNKIVTRIPKNCVKPHKKKRIFERSGIVHWISAKSSAKRASFRFFFKGEKVGSVTFASPPVTVHVRTLHIGNPGAHIFIHMGVDFMAPLRDARAECGRSAELLTQRKNETEQEVKAARIPCLPMLFKPASRAGQLNSISKRNP